MSFTMQLELWQTLNYATIEKEFIAIVFALEKISLIFAFLNVDSLH